MSESKQELGFSAEKAIAELQRLDAVMKTASKTATDYAKTLSKFSGRGFERQTQQAEIDKAFLIAQPMGKASWTKCFAAGGGSVGGSVEIVLGTGSVAWIAWLR